MPGHHRVFRYSFISTVVLATFFARTGYSQRSLRAQVVKHAKPYVDSQVVVGLSVGVLKGDESATVHLGRTGPNGKRPNDITVYEIGSISKVFTGLLLADAVTSNKLQLDQNAQDLLPNGVRMPNWKDQPITLLDMATHYSGLPRLSNNMPFGNPSNPYVDYPSKLAHEFLNQYQLTRAPGEKREYSNFAVALLGHMVCENAQALSYDKLLQQRIAEPLGMKSTSVQLSSSMKKRFATPHSAVDVTTSSWEFADMPGAGGIRSTTRDMLAFAKANMNPPDGALGEAINLAWKEHKTEESKKMGLGWHFADDGSTRWHNGQTGGFHSMIMINRDARIGLVLLTNTGTSEVDRLANDLMLMLAGVDINPREFPKAIEVDEVIMKRYVGRYELAPNFIFTVTVKDKRLMVGVTGQPTHRVYPKNETTWFYKVVPAEITFKVNQKGECSALELFQNGARQVAKRIK